MLVSEPGRQSLAVGIQALKLSVARRSKHGPFWQARYYDFTVFTEGKRVEKLEYMHWNPVRRGLLETMERWLWSSYRAGGPGLIFETWVYAYVGELECHLFHNYP
jgi:putative transposase